MFPPKGYFASFVCPFYLTGFCDRQHCHFRHSDRSQSSDEVLLKEIICEENKVLHEKQLRDKLTSSFTNRVVKDNLTEKAGEDRNHVEQQKGISYKATPIEELQMMSFPTTKPFYSHSSEKTNVKDEKSKDQNTSGSTNLNNLIVVDHCYTSPLANPQRESNLTFLKNKTFSLECGLQNHSFIPFVKESEIIANSLGFQSHKNEKEKESKQLSKPCKDSNKSLSRIEKEEKHRKEISGKKDNKESRKTSKQTTDHEMGKSEKIRKTEENLENIYGLNKHKSSKPNLSEDNDFEDLFKPKKEKKHHKEKKHKKERSEKKLEEEIKHKKIISKGNEKLKRKEDCLKNINCGLNKDNKSISTPESKLSDDNSTDNLFKVYKEKRHKKKSSDKEPKEKIKSKQIVSKDNDKKVKKKGEGLKNMSGLINPSLPIFKPENEMKAKEKSSSRINKQMENTCNSESVIVVDSEPEMDTEENVKSKKRRTKSEILFPMFSSNQSKESDNGNKNTNKASLTSVPFTASKVQDEDYLLDNRVQSRKKTRVSLGYTWRPPPKKRVEVMTPAQRIALFRKLKENKEKGLPG